MNNLIMKKVIFLVDQINPDERLWLLEYLSRHLRRPLRQQRGSLRGIWKGVFPETFDIDFELKQMRSTWKSETKQLANG
ncbi:MAG: hypothetical protein HY769_08400 [Candidatus Stahlbacteria bacterium]|nr:hypothetical protein [Candidatus Stahlbacteria bacterium]